MDIKKLLMAGTTFALAASVQAQLAQIESALGSGKASGEVGILGTWGEIEMGNESEDGAYAVGFLRLNYATEAYKGFSANVGFFGTTELYDSEDMIYDALYSGGNVLGINMTDEVTMPVACINYTNADFTASIGRMSTAGTHFFGSNMEALTFGFNGIKNTKLSAGIVQGLADVDMYKTIDFMNIDEMAITEDAENYVIFMEGVFTGIDMVSLNPYIYYNKDYAAVYGIDAGFSYAQEDITWGVDVCGYMTDPDVDDADSKFNWAIIPSINYRNFTLRGGYAMYGSGDGVIAPAWFNEYFLDGIGGEEFKYITQMGAAMPTGDEVDVNAIFANLTYQGQGWMAKTGYCVLNMDAYGDDMDLDVMELSGSYDVSDKTTVKAGIYRYEMDGDMGMEGKLTKAEVSASTEF
jgi:hypothetical protein